MTSTERRAPNGSSAETDGASSPESTRRRVSLLGVEIDDLDETEVVDLVVSASVDGRGGWVVTPNVDILRMIVSDRTLRDTVAGADLLIADGMPLVWASRLKGSPLRARVPASGLVYPLARSLAERGLRLYLLGAEPGVAEAAARALTSHAPGLVVAGTYAPPIGFDLDEMELARIEDRLAEAAPQVVLCAFGCPKQERLMARLIARFPGTWFFGVGGTFAMVAGRLPKAPLWMQRLGLEWVHRLRLEPGRLWIRYLVQDAPFAFRLLSACLLARWRHRVDGAA